MATARVRIGELLVDAQIITRGQLEEVLALQRDDGRRLGTLLVESGLVTETQVTQILSQQLSVPWVSLYHIDFSRQLLNLVPQDLAEKYCLVPIFVRRVRGLGETLYVAMDDPSDESAQREVSQRAGLPVRAMIAPPTDIRSAIRVYYGGGNDSPSLLQAVAEIEYEQPKQGSPAQTEVRKEPVSSAGPSAGAEPRVSSEELPAASAPPALEIPEPQPVEPPPSAEPAAVAPSQPEAPRRDSSPTIETREVTLPEPRPKPRGLTLTLLDGTQLRLPVRKRAHRTAESAEGEALTGRDLVAALRAAAHGADVKEILGENPRWEALFSALLSVLLKKHLITDQELLEELKKS